MMLPPSSDAIGLREAAGTADRAAAALLVELLQGPLGDPDRPGSRHTLLAVCPNSPAVVRAALKAAQEARTPLFYAATLNQVDRDGGYTGWTPAAFVDRVATEVEQLEVNVPVLLGLDHAGPWKKDQHADLDYEAAMTEVKHSITACVQAGYDLLHIDPTVDSRQADGSISVDTLVDRTVELMRHAEDVRRASGQPPVAYEVGREDVDKSGESEDRLRSFLTQLDEALQIHDLPDPTFVVTNLGTRPGSGDFNPKRARQRTQLTTQQFGALLKGHYTDDVTTPDAYPISGMGGANVGPGLAAVEVGALRQLVALEHRLDPSTPSNVLSVLHDAVVESGRWRKWLRPEEEAQPFDTLPEDQRRWLVETGSRYVWTHDWVEEARSVLYDNVSSYRDAEAFVEWRLKTTILSYMHAFNLINLSDRLVQVLPEHVS